MMVPTFAGTRVSPHWRTAGWRLASKERELCQDNLPWISAPPTRSSLSWRQAPCESCTCLAWRGSSPWTNLPSFPLQSICLKPCGPGSSFGSGSGRYRSGSRRSTRTTATTRHRHEASHRVSSRFWGSSRIARSPSWKAKNSQRRRPLSCSCGSCLRQRVSNAFASPISRSQRPSVTTNPTVPPCKPSPSA